MMTAVDYKKDLEKAARQMILVHKVDTLAKLILRTIIRTIKVSHVGIFLHDRSTDSYVIRVSKGQRGVKVPVGFAKITKADPLVRYFIDPTYASFKHDFILHDRIKYYLRSEKVQKDKNLTDYFNCIEDAFYLYQAKAFVPGFFGNDLSFVLFLGAKEDKSNLTTEEMGFLSILASDIVMAIKNATLFEDLNQQLDNNKRLFLNTVSSLANAIEAKDQYTLGHTARVVEYSLTIAKNLVPHISKITEEELKIAALLHDIGKIGIPERVLNKDSGLDPSERALINKHPMIGADILSPVSEFSNIINGVKYHHERFDGKGYPFGIAGDKIPLIASIISVADTFDAMTSDRAYRKALSREVTINEIKNNSAKQFDPKIVDAFMHAFDKPEKVAAAVSSSDTINDED